MNLILNLPPTVEAQLAAEAARQGLSVAELATRILSGSLNVQPTPQTGAELVAWWKAEGLIGTRPDITDPSSHARDLRAEAQTRPKA